MVNRAGGGFKRRVSALFPVVHQIKGAFQNFMLRKKVAKRGVRIDFGVSIVDCEFGDYANIAYRVQASDSYIGKRSSIGRYSKLRRARIGDYCSISWDVTIGAAAHTLSNPSTHCFWHMSQFGVVNFDTPIQNEEQVVIGNDVWIGCYAIIMPGVTISDGAVIGAGSIVTKDVPPYAIVAGSPARILRYRFDKHDIDYLLQMLWWNWDEIKLKEEVNAGFFSRALCEGDCETPSSMNSNNAPV